jgi:hypothetical protein
MCDQRFLPQALVLQRSLERHAAPFRLRILCMDAASERALTGAPLTGTEAVSLAELEEFDPALAALREERSWGEFCWTSTPSFCCLGLETAEQDVVLWVDADLEFLRDPRALLEELGDGSILLTPHNYYRTYPGAAPGTYLTERWGRFNGGTIAFRRDDQGRAAVALWRSRTIEWCHDRLEPGRFGNQLHLVDFPARFKATRVLSVPGGGLGPWNSGQYGIATNGAEITAEGFPVTFYHHQSLRLYRRPAWLRPFALPSNMFVLPGRRDLVARVNPRYRIPRAERRLIWRPYLRRLAEAAGELADGRLGTDPVFDRLAFVHIRSDAERRLRIRAASIRYGVGHAARALRRRSRPRRRDLVPPRGGSEVRVTAITMVRNESDLIEAFVRHHAQIVDELVVVDHRSADGTDEIVAALAAEGLPVKLRSERSPVQRQNVVMTQLMKEAAAGGSDWVVPLDADEFLIAPDGEVRDVLADLRPERPWTVDMRLYVPTPDDPRDEPNVLRRIGHRRELEADKWNRKAIVPASWARDRRFFLAQGNHELLSARTRRFVPGVFTNRLALAHFPVRSTRQLAAKALAGWPAHLARPDRAEDGAWQWKRLFEEIVAGGELSEERFYSLALDYATREPGSSPQLVFDPVPAPFELRYRRPREPDPIDLLAEAAVGFAEELGDRLRDDGGDPSKAPARWRNRVGPIRAARRLG